MIDPNANNKGDIVVGSGKRESLLVPVGLPGQVFTADPTQRTGVSWQDASGGPGASGPKAVASSGIQLVSFLSNTSDSWSLGPAEYRVPIAAEVGDVLLMISHLLTRIDGDAELDVVSVVSAAPARYLSTGTAVPGPNGHGGLYLGTLYSRAVPAIRWTVAAEDLDGDEVTLSILRRNGAGGATLGSAAYPGEITVTNLGKVPA